jgi:NAD(P)-dependent dehydrogenase (short-subunit alcohol dehydrogenase family)
MLMETTPKVAVVTGAGSGIGQAVTLGLLATCYRVVLVGRRAESLQSTVAKSGASPDQFLVIPTDVTDPSAVATLFKRVHEHFGRVDVLFNNAGINTLGVPLEDLAFEEWKRVIDTNLHGAFLCAQGAFRLMKNQQPPGGRIINNGSISAHVPRPNSVAYTASKHAITGLTKSLSLDGRAFGIACGQIDIGNADTQMTGRMKRGIIQANGSLAVEPTVELRHVVDAVLYLCALPLDVNVPTMTVMANQMPYIGRG